MKNFKPKPWKLVQTAVLGSFWGFVVCQHCAGQQAPEQTRLFLEQHCYDCHEGSGSEGGLDLTLLTNHLDNSNTEDWVRIFDRVKDGEMPPSDYGELDAEIRQPFLSATGEWISAVQSKEFDRLGRVKARRLTNLQLERTLHDLLGIDIPLARRMPEESRTNGFTTVADGQPMSHFQLQQHLDVVDIALDEAFRRALGPDDEWTKKFPASKIVRRNPRQRTREPEMLDGHAVVWSGRLVFYGRIPATTAQEDGWYRFKIRSKGLKVPSDKNIWCTIRSGQCRSSAPLMGWVGAYEVDENYKEVTVETWLPRGHMLEIRPGDLTLKRARFRGGQVGAGEGGPQNVPGVAIESIEMQRIHQGPNNDAIRKMLFGNLKVQPSASRYRAKVESESPKNEIAQRMLDFANRAYRRPVDSLTIEPFVTLATDSYERSRDLVDALRNGYRALLCSPRFIFFREQPGPLDGYAIAARLSYLIWNRMPDDRLLELAAKNQLHRKSVLRAQVDRMLTDPRGQHFVCDLADQWLDLNLIDFTEPDGRLYPGFDIIVQNSMLAETHAFLQKILDDDLNVGHLIDSDFTFLNNRLARYYGIPNVDGDDLKWVSLPEKSERGGLLTQGSIMKVTANGTNTSPVIRGVWVSERLLGVPIPPPPQNVPAIEPDIRGAKTIREMLAKHKQNDDCASCHRKIDPPGFALEHFDPSGRWRDSYVQKNGRKRTQLPIDSSFEMPDGRPFQNLAEFKRLVLTDQHRLAHNVAEKLLIYGTGAPVQFADRDEVDQIVQQTKPQDYGLKSILKSVVTSEIFLTK